MAQFFIRHLRTVALASATITSAYLSIPDVQTPIDLLKLFTVKAAEYVNEISSKENISLLFLPGTKTSRSEIISISFDGAKEKKGR